LRTHDRRVKPGDDDYLMKSTHYVMPGLDPGIQARVEHLAGSYHWGWKSACQLDPKQR
jgi:hypothetical protein